MNHTLKTHPEFFDAVERGEKTFEVRRNDRNFAVGDTLTLQRFDPETQSFTGAELHKQISYILQGGQFGVAPDVCVLAMQDVEACLPIQIERSAVISECEQYRYELRRIWDIEKGLVNFIGLNPSTADAQVDDPTIRRCIGFARDWGYGGLIMTNLFAYRLTDSRQLKNVPAPHGIQNWHWLEQASQEARIVVAAWGSHPMAKAQGERTRFRLDKHSSVALKCIKQTQPGVPWHPLYLKADLQPIEFKP